MKAKQALTLKGVKRPKVVFGCSLEHITFLREKGRRKRGKARIWQEIKFWLDLFPISCSKETKQHTIRDFEEVQGNKSNPNLILFDLDFGEKP